MKAPSTAGRQGDTVTRAEHGGASGLTWTNEKRRLSELVPWPRNPRTIKGDEARRLGESLEEFGQPETFAVGPGNEVYNGHQRLRTWLARFGDMEVDVRVASRPLTEKEREKLTVFLHRGAVGEWDFDVLADEFEIGDLLEWGFEEGELDFDMTPVGEDPGPQIDKAEELRQKWGTESGQLWALGEHRIVCGDCTDAAVVGRVAPNEQADLWLTDPPYGVSYADKNRFLNTISPGNRIQEPIANDHLSLDDAAALWKQAALIALGVCADHASYYWFACQGGDQMMMMMMLHKSGWRVRHELIWVKNNHVLGRTDYNYKHEPILYGWKQDGKHRFWGGFQTSVLEFAKPQASDLHPTTKPIELIERLLVNSSQPGELVLDSFLGSGTTLIACERLGRRCRGIEISPAYIAVTLERWATMTGIEPVLLDSTAGANTS